MAVRRGRGQHEPIAPVIPLRPATTPEARENQLIADAVDLAQRQLRDGTASAQVITHFLKLGSTREQLEQERLQKKGEAMESAKRIEELYGQALSAMRTYQGQPDLALEGLTDEDL
jgi:hypothetical protein